MMLTTERLEDLVHAAPPARRNVILTDTLNSTLSSICTPSRHTSDASRATTKQYNPCFSQSMTGTLEDETQLQLDAALDDGLLQSLSTPSHTAFDTCSEVEPQDVAAYSVIDMDRLRQEELHSMS